MGERLHVEMKSGFTVEGLTPTEVMVYLDHIVKETFEYINKSGRKIEMEDVQSIISSITGFSEEGEEIQYLDEKGRLQDAEGIEKAIQEGLLGKLEN